jgi:hypothetical protein
MVEYVQAEEQDARRYSGTAAQQHAAAQIANDTSDTYVLLTVLFATVLFFGGIGSTFRSARIRQALAGVATLLFVATVVFLASMPVCRE